MKEVVKLFTAWGREHLKCVLQGSVAHARVWGTSGKGTEPNHRRDLRKEFMKMKAEFMKMKAARGEGGWATQVQGSGRYRLPVME